MYQKYSFFWQVAAIIIKLKFVDIFVEKLNSLHFTELNQMQLDGEGIVDE